MPDRTIPVVRRERAEQKREPTAADLDRMAAAEAKRARKAAKRRAQP